MRILEWSYHVCSGRSMRSQANLLLRGRCLTCGLALGIHLGWAHFHRYRSQMMLLELSKVVNTYLEGWDPEKQRFMRESLKEELCEMRT